MSYSKYTNYFIKSKNFNSRNDCKVSFLVLHCTEETYERTIEIFTTGEVSAHYVVDLNGEITCMVNEEDRAWHAGISCWKGVDGLNSVSIGIEVVGYADKCYPKIQIDAVQKLSLDIIERYNILKSNVVAHSDIGTVNDVGLRKTDPGRYFPWQYLAESGVGSKLSPAADQLKNPADILYNLGDQNCEILQLKNDLNKYGYQIKDGNFTNLYDAYFSNVVHQFKLHFVPEQSFLDNTPSRTWDILSQERLNYLLSQEKKFSE